MGKVTAKKSGVVIASNGTEPWEIHLGGSQEKIVGKPSLNEVSEVRDRLSSIIANTQKYLSILLQQNAMETCDNLTNRE